MFKTPLPIQLDFDATKAEQIMPLAFIVIRTSVGRRTLFSLSPAAWAMLRVLQCVALMGFS
jgi:hypothetical protein